MPNLPKQPRPDRHARHPPGVGRRAHRRPPGPDEPATAPPSGATSNGPTSSASRSPSPTSGRTWRCSATGSATGTAARSPASSIRLLVAGPGSALGRYPLGNTGGANVSAVTPMPIPADLRAVLARHRPGVVVTAIATATDHARRRRERSAGVSPSAWPRPPWRWRSGGSNRRPSTPSWSP